MSVAHPIFYAIGAYCSGLLAIHLQIPVPLLYPDGSRNRDGALIRRVAALASRGRADYLVIASIGFQLGILHVINNLEFTGAAGGLTNIPVLNEGPSRSLVFVLLIAVVAACAVLLVGWIVEGDYGRAITAMRNDEEAFSALGRNAMNIKIVLFAIGSGMAGLAGALYAHYFRLRHARAIRYIHICGPVDDGGRGRRRHDVGTSGGRGAPDDPSAGHHVSRPARLHHGAASGASSIRRSSYSSSSHALKA